MSIVERPLRVLHSHPVWLPQTQPWLYNLVRHLPDSAVQSRVVCDRTENLEQFRVPRLHALSDLRYWSFWNQRLVTRFLARPPARFLRTLGQRFGTELVHSHFGNIGWRDLPAVRQMPARHVVTFYGFEIGQLPKREPVWLDRYAEMFPTVDLITCEGPFMAQSIVDLGCPQDKIRVHRLGIETEQISYCRRQWKIGTPLRILIAASFVAKKGIPSALHALARIKNDVSLEITIIGGARADPRSQTEKERILEAISAGGLEDRVQQLGFQPHQRMLDEAYRNHIFLSPSLTAPDGDTEGGLPVGIIEMVATGLPVVSTRHCDIPTVLEHGRTGFLAEEGDVDGIAECLRWLIRHPDQWNGITDAARKHVDRNFNAAIQGRELADLYAEVLCEARSRPREARNDFSRRKN
jgi:colanic acid/amylovoran biosynthesis glycosyltransferase